MDTDFKSLEKRYGTSLAIKICEEIAKAEQSYFNYYRANVALKSIKRFVDESEDQRLVARNKVA
ncbi:MAG: hypothetical protein EB059_06595 [Alphaproteobacteria bacterium]|nr:hypothetical protein [Alphaproteobacteria bacterium]